MAAKEKFCGQSASFAASFAASLQPLPLHILKTLAAIGRIIGRKNRELAARKNFCGQREALGQ
ncbi:hypothetical protein MTAT_04840 [Moorella thermoacetica]|uniref:Uncharacterized protein n=1 Tax=Neomoorella thermoacetica TaxID=1525 RepID=A0A5D3I3F3_NEOTH|nr:hypothetical protein Maut_01406 [Moorella thermoacetica]OIQ12803.1 hypothetical protein MOOTH_01870 [Moorella thermoacetica]TYL14255.1 hypothetical protein MTAT_04840 [Moorella thermoacetica]